MLKIKIKKKGLGTLEWRESKFFSNIEVSHVDLDEEVLLLIRKGTNSSFRVDNDTYDIIAITKKGDLYIEEEELLCSKGYLTEDQVLEEIVKLKKHFGEKKCTL